MLVAFAGCNKGDITPSETKSLSVPTIATQFANDTYIFGLGSGQINKSIPELVAVAVDTVYGFEGGYGGKTGKDSIQLKKSQGSWPDTTKAGAGKLTIEAFNMLGYKVEQTVTIVVAAPNTNPGPTDLAGNYKRTSNGYLISLTKVFNGVYVIDNPGGAAVALQPYLLYNYKSSTNTDSLAFANQTNPCGGGLRLVSSTAPNGKASSEYNKYPPLITSLSPVTLAWKIFEFPSTSSSSITAAPDALCQWGATATRTFEKQ